MNGVNFIQFRSNFILNLAIKNYKIFINPKQYVQNKMFNSLYFKHLYFLIKDI